MPVHLCGMALRASRGSVQLSYILNFMPDSSMPTVSRTIERRDFFPGALGIRNGENMKVRGARCDHTHLPVSTFWVHLSHILPSRSSP